VICGAKRNFTALGREQGEITISATWRELNMEMPEGNSRQPRSGPHRRPAPGGTAGGTRATVAGTPVVKGDLYASEGHGLFLVQHLAAQWGYLRDPAGTTVWFHLPTAQSQPAAEPAGPQAGSLAGRPPGRPGHARPTQLWAAAIQPTPA
jgi:hypothetical protein